MAAPFHIILGMRHFRRHHIHGKSINFTKTPIMLPPRLEHGSYELKMSEFGVHD